MTYSAVVTFVESDLPFDPLALENVGDRYRVDFMTDDTVFSSCYFDADSFEVEMAVVGAIVPFIASSGLTDTSITSETYSYPPDFVSQYIVNNTQLDLDAAYQRCSA